MSLNFFGERAIPSTLSYAEVRPVLRWVYVWMAFGLLITAAVSFVTVSSDALLMTLVQEPGLLFGAIIVELALVIALSWGIRRMSPGLAAALFVAYAAVNGFTLSLIFVVYDIGSITAAFVTAAALFAAMTVVGFTTSIDLTQFRGYFLMGLIGLLIAMVVNLFIASSALDFVISIAGVLIFTGLTAYDTQYIKRMAEAPEVQADGSMAARISIIGALKLYLDFINLFLFLLRLFGRRR